MKLEEELTREVEILGYNLKKISLINKIYLTIFIFLMIVFNISGLFPSIESSNSLSPALLQYITTFIIIFVYFYILDLRKVDVTASNYKKMKLLVYFFIFYFFNAAALLPAIDDNISHPIFIYSLILLSSIPLLVITKTQLLIPLGISSILLAFHFHSENESLFIPQIISLGMLLPIIYIISRSTHFAYMRTLDLQKNMTQEVRQLRNQAVFLKEAIRQLELENRLDPLTNLYNRRAYNDYLLDFQEGIGKTLHSFSVIMVDVDCFKLYNDTYGHAEGDEVLVKIGELLNSISQQFDCFAGRFGGEEFVIILPNECDKVVESICCRIREGVLKLNIQHLSSSVDTVVTVSIGACTKMITELNEINECIREADRALYRVKESGRNGYEYRHEFKVAKDEASIII